MASYSDDEEIFPEVVSEYYFCNAYDEPVSFIEVPIQWSSDERSYDNKSRIYLRGKTDNGLQMLHKQVKAWKYEFLIAKPEILVLSTDNRWIELQKPRKSFESKIRTILITVQCLHFLCRKPKASREDLWDHLCKVFSLYAMRPSENDLMDHLNFIREAVKRDIRLQKSKLLASLLKERSRKRKAVYQNAEAIMKPSFIVDDKVCEYEDSDEDTESESDNDDDDYVDEDDINDRVCAICDNGGDLTCCDGKCLRAFHATHKSARSAKSSCKSLGLQPEEVKGSQPFVCLNCSHEQHQCFVCGKLGSSSESYGAEVFRCSLATCGHFYHPDCVAKLLEDESVTEARNIEKKIAGGEAFICPAHTCHKCKRAEDEEVQGLQFAVCRRCPRSYHRKCLPSKIMFRNKANDKEVVARAWNGLLPKSRALIYCLKHKMDHELGTAVRNIKFPVINHCSKNVAVIVNEDAVNSDSKSYEKSVEMSASSVRLTDSSIKIVEVSSESEPSVKQSVSVTHKKPLLRNLSIEVESDFRMDHLLVDEDEQIATVAENNQMSSGLERVVKKSVSVTDKKPLLRNLSIEAESDFKTDHILIDEDEQIATVTENDKMSYGLERVVKQRVSVTNNKPLSKNLSIEAERDSKLDHIPVDEDEQIATVTENDKFPSLDANNSHERMLKMMKDTSSSMTLDMSKRSYNIATRDRDNKSVKLDNAQQGYTCKAHIDKRRKYETSSWSQNTAYTRGHHDSGSYTRYRLADADPSSYNRLRTFAMNQYTPRLDELNYTWMMKNREMGGYYRPVGPRMDDYRFATQPDDPVLYHNRHHPAPRDFKHPHDQWRYNHRPIPQRYKQQYSPRHHPYQHV